MKQPFYRKLNIHFYSTVCVIFIFALVALLYRNFSRGLDAASAAEPDFLPLLRSQATRFAYELLIVLTLALTLFFVVFLLYRFRMDRLRQDFLQAAARYQIAFENLGESIWEYDIRRDVLKKSNASAGVCTGLTNIPDFRTYILESGLINVNDRETLLHFFDSFLSHEDIPMSVQVRAATANGEEAWYELHAHRVFDGSGIPVSVIGRTVNITKQKQKESEKKALEGQDSLTRLYNKDTVRMMIDQYLDSIDSAVISALFLIDLDRFTKLNEVLGASFGDATLLDLSTRLKKRFPNENILGRVGGDSFVVFLANVPSISYISECGEELCSMIRDIYSGSPTLSALTGSIGGAVFPTDGSRFDTLCEKAARALWEAKQLGRDRCLVWSANLDDGGESHVSDYISEDISSAPSALGGGHSLVNTNIIMNAIEILFDSQENDDTLQMLLSLIGTFYNLNRISVVQYDHDFRTASITHEWTSHARYQLKEAYQGVPFAQDNYYARYRESENGVFYSDSYLIRLQEGMLIDPIPDRRACPYFQCGFVDHGNYIGCISIAVNDGSHGWSQNEIDSLTLISKIIGSYIVRLRSIRYANWLSKNDPLTGAFNFNSFLSEVNKLHAEKPDQVLAMFYSDIRQFKLINDNYGYQTGDMVLQSITNLYRTIFPGGILCRISGDKFALCTRCSDEEALAAKAKLLISRCRQLVSPQGEALRLSLVLGIYVMSGKDTAITAVDRANIARKNAQRHDTAGYSFFTSTMRSSLILQKDLEDSMENSLLENRFLLYFQPKFNINTRTLCGAEALVRWQHPSLGFLYPNAFIPLFESNGFIIDLDYYMFEQVCIFIRDELKKGAELFPISVNFSREHFKTDGLPEKLKTAVEFYDIPPGLIEIEITESAFAVVDRHFVWLLSRIRSYGFRLAMDDFGSGLSSLNLLCDLPFNVLKIDKDFFHSKTTKKRERIVISSTVRMASELEMEVICEGVETEEQAEFLKSIGCSMAQGYLYSKPVSREEFIEKYSL
ncbi:MAG: EAL domain-containing protein [Lachnospiraceae bacterium]|nr:EAL domain-containing protein [Lachnospiraceae bacterium]